MYMGLCRTPPAQSVNRRTIPPGIPKTTVYSTHAAAFTLVMHHLFVEDGRDIRMQKTGFFKCPFGEFISCGGGISHS